MNKMAAFFYAAWLEWEIYRRFLVNKHGDLYFLLQNFDVQIVLFEMENLKKISSGKKDTAECVHNIVTQGRKLCPWKQRPEERFDSMLFGFIWIFP